MKKFILGFLVLVSLFSFTYQFNSFNHDLKEYYERRVFHVSDVYKNTVDIILYENINDLRSFEEQAIQVLDYANKNDYMLSANIAEVDSMGKNIDQYIYILNHFEEYQLLPDYYYVGDTVLTKGTIISTKEDADLRLKYFDQRYYTANFRGSDTIMFKESLAFVDDLPKASIHFSIHYKDGVNTNFEAELTDILGYNFDYFGDYDAGNRNIILENSNDTSLLLLILSVVMLCILLIVYVVKKDQAVAISKMQGNSSFVITYHEYGKLLLTIIGVFLLSFLLQYVLRVNDYTTLGFLFIKALLPQVLLLCSACIILFIVLYTYVFTFKFIHVLRKDEKNISMFAISFILKIVLFALLANPMLKLVNDVTQSLQFYKQIHEVEDFYNDYILIDFIQENSMSSSYELHLNLSEYLTTKGAIYASAPTIHIGNLYPPVCRLPVSNVPVSCDEGKNLEKYPDVYYVNQTFLEKYTNYTVSEDTENTIFIPKNKMDQFDLQNHQNQYNTIIVIENGLVLPLIELNIPRTSTSVTDAIIISTNRTQLLHTLFIPNDYDFSDPVFVEFMGKRKYTTVPAASVISSILEYENTTLQKSISLFLVYFMIIIAYLYQLVFLYFYTKKREISINYLLGKSYLEQYLPLFILTSISFFIIFFVLLFLGLSLIQSFFYCLSFFVVDLFLLLIMIKYFDSKTIPTVLKGDE